MEQILVAMFWVALVAIAYPYLIYPCLLVALNRLRPPAVADAQREHVPQVTILMPLHNEAARVPTKISNLRALDYPQQKMQIVAIADGCSDDSVSALREHGRGFVEIVELAEWSGKAAALNAGLSVARGDIVVFTDMAIRLEPQSLSRLVQHFSNPAIGCVSGEDYIEGQTSEGLYGRLELLLRREEAQLHSIAGASGCFYAQRRALCRPFVAGMAPDFLSVLVTAEAGYRSVAEPAARGVMTSTSSQKAEFSRKARTFLRGITALVVHAGLLNPLRHPAMSFILWSHKALRWLAPLAMIALLLASWMLRHDPLYRAALILQLIGYGAGALAILWPDVGRRIGMLRLASFFLIVNMAALRAMLWWLGGRRIETWEPTRRP